MHAGTLALNAAGSVRVGLRLRRVRDGAILFLHIIRGTDGFVAVFWSDVTYYMSPFPCCFQNTSFRVSERHYIYGPVILRRKVAYCVEKAGRTAWMPRMTL